MNEQYLFRGKRIDTGEWVYGCLIYGLFCKIKGGTDAVHILNVESIDYDGFTDLEEGYGYYEVDPATVGKCTGLRDRTGKLIWQGDIINGKFQNQRTTELICYGEYVSMKYYYYGWYTKDKSIEKYGINGNGGADSGYLSCCTVIGNIHDTPELLKEV